MNEKEIERLIVDNIIVDGCECGNVLEITASTAAHAIAEKMDKGVMLETRGAWLPPSATHKGILWIAGDEHSPAVVTGGLPTSMEGKEPVTVTVTKEE